jgi:SAM domain (Sterile alpha motif)
VDIAAWLKSLGIEQYEPAFRDNAIDADVLPKLTAEDLKDLGISAVGHRRKLLEAIAALRTLAAHSRRARNCTRGGGR